MSTLIERLSSDAADKIAREADKERHNQGFYGYVMAAAEPAIIEAIRSYSAALEAEVVTLKREQNVNAFTIDRLTMERDLAHAEVTDLLAEADHSANFAKAEADTRNRSEDRARQLEAELVAVVAERDRLKTAAREIYENLSSLEDEGFAPKTRLTWTETMDILRSALASNPLTEGSVTDSCGCVFCDMGLVPEARSRAFYHFPGGRAIKCTAISPANPSTEEGG